MPSLRFDCAGHYQLNLYEGSLTSIVQAKATIGALLVTDY
jgi:hypothetical protein